MVSYGCPQGLAEVSDQCLSNHHNAYSHTVLISPSVIACHTRLTQQAVWSSTAIPQDLTVISQENGGVMVGKRVDVDGYGLGVVEDLLADGAICQVRFCPGSFGAVCFPYGGLSLIRRERCTVSSSVSLCKTVSSRQLRRRGVQSDKVKLMHIMFFCCDRRTRNLSCPTSPPERPSWKPPVQPICPPPRLIQHPTADPSGTSLKIWRY